MWPWGHSMTLKTSKPQTNQWGRHATDDAWTNSIHTHTCTFPTLQPSWSRTELLSRSATVLMQHNEQFSRFVAFIIIWKQGFWMKFGCTQGRKGTNNQGGRPQAGHWIFTRCRYGALHLITVKCFQISKVNQHFRPPDHQAWVGRVTHSCWINSNLASCSLIVHSQTSWYFLLTTTEIPVIIPGWAHPCWIAGSGKFENTSHFLVIHHLTVTVFQM